MFLEQPNWGNTYVHGNVSSPIGNALCFGHWLIDSSLKGFLLEFVQEGILGF